MALELAPHRIRVNAIAPGLTDTAQPRYGGSEEEIAAAATLIPFGRIARPDEIAPGRAVFLAFGRVPGLCRAPCIACEWRGVFRVVPLRFLRRGARPRRGVAGHFGAEAGIGGRVEQFLDRHLSRCAVTRLWVAARSAAKDLWRVAASIAAS